MSTRPPSASLEHVGIAAADAPPVLRMLERLLGHAPYKEETIAREAVVTHFLKAGTAKLEVLESTRPDSPVGRFLKKRGDGVHHLAFDVPDIDAAYDDVRAKGFEPLSDAPQPGADGKNIFFLHPRDTCGLLIEFCQETTVLPTAQRVEAGKSSLAVYELGHAERPPIIVLHGLGGSAETEMVRLLRRLEPHFHVLAPDFAMHGNSDDPVGRPLTFDLLTDNVAAVQAHFGLGPVHLFGFSLGGRVALRYAQRYPSRVDRAAVLATNITWDESLAETTAQRLWRIKPGCAHGKEQWRHRLNHYATFASGLAAHVETVDARRITAPVLVSAFDADDLFPLDQAIQLHQQLPTSRLAVVPGARHTMHALPLGSYLPLLINWYADEVS